MIHMTLAQNGLESPSDYFPQYKENFTLHHEVVDYAYYLSENANTTFTRQYGTSTEGRPLVYMVISDGRNIQNLDSIQAYHLKYLKGEVSNIPDPYDKVIVWLSFGVHGNEAGATESALQSMYELVSGNIPGVNSWLDEAVVILDPCLNPDGYDRYTQFYRSRKGMFPNEDPAALEHDEPWPGGRVNHYLFDLNRDWAWQTQQESRERMKLYHQWLPHVHVDVHEQFPENPYYFAPAAKPHHEEIQDWQIDLQTNFGKNHAKYFDQNGWLYFTKQYFDLFYPSYGDTYPIFNGAIGMTHEQAGHGIAGAAYQTKNGQTLRIADRIDHHTTTALSTVETAADLKEQLIRNQKSFFLESEKGATEYYLYAPEEHLSLQQELASLLKANGFKFYCGNKLEGKKVNRTSISATGKEGSYNIQAHDIVIPSQQMNSKLLKVLMQLNPLLEDTATYDITSWGLPHAYGHFYKIDNFNLSSLEEGACKPEPPLTANKEDRMSYAYILEFQSLADYQKMFELMDAGLQVRMTKTPFKLNDIEYAAGTVVFLKADQDQTADHGQLLNQSHLIAVETGWSDEGPDLGSDDFELLQKPKVALIQDDRLDANSYGFAWYFLDQYLPKGYMAISSKSLIRNLDEFNTIILSGGGISLNSEDLQKLKKWVAQGGRMILIGSAVRQFSSDENWSLKPKQEKEKEQQSNSDYHDHHPGSVLKLEWDNRHPLGYHMTETYYSLSTESTAYDLEEGAQIVGKVPQDMEVFGFMGASVMEQQKNSAKFIVKTHGQGTLIYCVDDPLYRGFWKSGFQIMMNAIFFVK